jgi:prepilin-type N-terminal cleavage/methylation domain-containing protein
MQNKGFSLIEVLLSVFIITVAVLGLYNGVSYSFNSIEKAKNKLIATYLAEEGIELVKNIRDINFSTENTEWNDGFSACENGCRIDMNDTIEDGPNLPLNISNGFYSYEAGEPTIFSREITIEEYKDNEDKVNKVKVSSIVSYGKQEFLMLQYLYNYKEEENE